MKTKHLTPEELGRETQKLIDFKAEMKHMYAMSAGKEGTKKLFITGAGNFIG